MQGEFRGDFTRDSSNLTKHFRHVLLQGGRVQLDADWNEQVEILLDYVQCLGQDLISFHGGRGDGFKIFAAKDTDELKKAISLDTTAAQLSRSKEVDEFDIQADDFVIFPGRYYVEGIPCKHDDLLDAEGIPWTYNHQPYRRILDPEKSLSKLYDPDVPLLVYLDVWERHISYVEDYNPAIPGIREVGLGGPDTATRSQVVWQVKVIPAPGLEVMRNAGLRPIFEAKPLPDNSDNLVKLYAQIKNLARDSFRAYLQASSVELKPGNGRLKARAASVDKSTDLCRISPKSRFRGPENRLYRVEILRVVEHQPIFAWSRDNSAVIFPILNVNSGDDTITLHLEHLGRDSRYSISAGDWVELVHDVRVLDDQPRQLLKVDSTDTYERTVTLTQSASTATIDLGDIDQQQHPYLRRWDSPGELLVEQPIANNGWISLEDGIEIKFEDIPTDDKKSQPYRVDDYWLIPARTATGDVEWPKEAGSLQPKALLPKGITHYYAPLAIVSVSNGEVNVQGDCRRRFLKLWN